MENLTTDYKQWLTELKGKIRSVQIKAAIAVNSSLIRFYWELGEMIAEKQTQWGSKFLANLSKDLQTEFPEMKGFSERNLKYCRLFYHFYAPLIGQQAVAQSEGIENKDVAFSKQVVSQIPWSHNILIFTKSKDTKEAHFYASQTIENGWSRDTLSFQLDSKLYERSGKAVSNFKNPLPEPLSIWRSKHSKTLIFLTS